MSELCGRSTGGDRDGDEIGDRAWNIVNRLAQVKRIDFVFPVIPEFWK